MTLPRWIPGGVLFVLAAASSWMLWQLQREQAPAPLHGPPRSDYALIDFELVALDDAGAESFRVHGPMLSRHPHLGTLEIEKPRFRFPDANSAPWDARAGHAWVSARGDELHLSENVEFLGPSEAQGQRIELRTPELIVLPKQNSVRNESTVTLIGPGSILRGRNLRGDLDARRFRLLEVTGEYAPAPR